MKPAKDRNMAGFLENDFVLSQIKLVRQSGDFHSMQVFETHYHVEGF